MLIHLLLAGAVASAPSHAAHYPAELRGTWQLGSERCDEPVDPNDDGVMRIGRDGIAAYESTISAYSIRRVASHPPTWRLDEVEEYEGETRRFRRTLILSGNSLLSREGSSRQLYTRCTARIHRR